MLERDVLTVAWNVHSEATKLQDQHRVKFARGEGEIHCMRNQEDKPLRVAVRNRRTESRGMMYGETFHVK